MTNLEKLIETLQKAPIERTACFIFNNFDVRYKCHFCAFAFTEECIRNNNYKTILDCKNGIKQWLESEVE